MQSLDLPLAPPFVRRGVLALSTDELLAWLKEQDQPPLRARQIRSWLIAKRATAFDQMTDLPLRLREALANEFQPLATSIERHLKSIDGTHKLLLRLHDGQVIE